MRIFAASDIHGNKTIMKKLSSVANSVDLILICGDIGGKSGRFRTLRDFSNYQKQDELELLKIIKSFSLTTPVWYILGNDDWFDSDHYQHLKSPQNINNIDVIPFEYVSLTPFNTNREANENKLEYELTKLTDDFIDNFNSTVILAHTPPFGAGDTLYNGSHCGSKFIRNWILEYQPKIWLCGHIHEDNSVNHIGNTLVFNCSCQSETNQLRGWVIDTDTLLYQPVKI
jgi:hypothetical protein